MALLNYTTSTSVDTSVSQIQAALSKVGVSGVLTEYEDGYVTALSFRLKLNDQDISFRLPTDWKPVLEALRQQKAKQVRGHGHITLTEEQARRVAWRITKDWVEAQCAFIETMMVTTAQVFLPYAVTASGQSLYEYIGGNTGLLLGDGRS